MYNGKRPATEQEIKDALLEAMLRVHLSIGAALPLKEVAEKIGCDVREVRLATRPIVEEIYAKLIYDDNLRSYLISRNC